LSAFPELISKDKKLQPIMTEFDENGANFTMEDLMSTDIFLTTNATNLQNETDFYPEEDYIYDKIYIRVIFMSVYTIVFCLCFFGECVHTYIFAFNELDESD
jgi:hypothetical protein